MFALAHKIGFPTENSNLCHLPVNVQKCFAILYFPTETDFEYQQDRSHDDH